MKHRKDAFVPHAVMDPRDAARSNDETAERIRRIIRRQLGVDDACIVSRASFIEDLGADSVCLIELTLALEEEFEIDISDEDAERIRTVGDAVDYIGHRMKRLRAGSS